MEVTCMMYGYYNYVPWGGLGFIIPILFWVLLVVLLVGIFSRGMRYGNHGNHERFRMEKTPLDILQERYAKGEIEKKEYEEKKKDLS